MKRIKEKLARQKGYFLSTILVLALVIIIMTTALIYITINQKKYFQANREKSSARQVAEAGINYYLWHLAHNNEDYADGTGDTCNPTCGPYTHDYKNALGEVVGTYNIEITPPETGENYATVVATGQLNESPEKKVVEARLGIPSFARYGFLSTSEVWFANFETSYGPVHTNYGIRHQGNAYNGIVTSSKTTYHSAYFGGDHPGVWCDNPPTCPLLHSGYSFPVPAVDFNKITADLAQMKIDSQPANGGLYFGASGKKGYHIVLNQTNFQLYRVDTTQCYASHPTCSVYDQMQKLPKIVVSDSIVTQTLLGTYNFPANGIVFTEDNLWIEGTINDAQLTFAAARFPDTASTNARIVVNNNLLYTNYDGRDKIGLIAQSYITLPRSSPNYLEIDAAMVSQHSYVEWHKYDGILYQRIKVHGSMGTNGGLAWTYGSPAVSGYKQTITEYDEYLTFGPPPSFPTTGTYAILYWEEVP